MTPIHRSRPQQIAAGFVFVAVGGIGFLPLFNGPGYENTLAAGLLVPSAAAIATALEVSRADDVAPLACAMRGVVSGVALAAIAFFTAVVHGVFSGMCDLWGGAGLFWLNAGVGAVLGGVWGAVVGELCRGLGWRRLACVLGALAAPLGSIVVSVLRFYGSPIIFAFDPFVGYFSGTLFDTIIDAGTPLWTYRAGSAATLAAVLSFASLASRVGGRRRFAAFWRTRDAKLWARAALFVAALATSLGVTVSGASLGHWQTASTIKRELGGFRAGARCDVVYPDSLRPDEVDLVLRDCEEELASVEELLGARGPERVTAFFFRDAAEKKRLMGAADTYIAKPWRAEVYLQHAAYPHPVLGHELAHVVAGSFGRGPFRIAGAAGGWWPNPGLIEGTAVAASPDDDELTDAQWARAMMDLGILPPMSDIFSFNFLGQNSAKSYTLAGAFIRWLIDKHGSATLRAWYGGEPIEKASGKSLAELDLAFRADLAAERLSPEAAAFAKAKFDRPSVFGRKCPHTIDALKRDASRCAESHQIDRALRLYGDALGRDPKDFGAHHSRGVLELRYGDADRGKTELSAIADDEKAPRTWRDKSEEAIADGELLAGDFEAAAARYSALAARTVDEDAGRTLEVKALAAPDLPARRAIEAMLIGAPGRPADSWLAAIYLGTWSDQQADPLADYLIGRNLVQRGWYAVAARYLDRALGAGAPTVRVGRELIRQRAVAACAMSDAPEVARMRAIIGADGSPFRDSSGGRREWVLRMLARCR